MLPLFDTDDEPQAPNTGASDRDRPEAGPNRDQGERAHQDPAAPRGSHDFPPDGHLNEGRAAATQPAPPDPEVEIRISRRRRKTATAFWEEDRIVVVVPSHVHGRDRQEIVDWLVTRARAKRPGMGTGDEALALRAASLADRYVDGVRPSSIRWVTNQNKRWGSCSTHSGEIRLSHRLQSVPDWVLDAIIVHELAHLVLPDHSPRFHEIAGRYPRQSEAALFLEGYQLGLGQNR